MENRAILDHDESSAAAGRLTPGGNDDDEDTDERPQRPQRPQKKLKSGGSDVDLSDI